MYTFFCPVNAVVNVNATFRVRVLPEVLNEDPVPANVHWLFDTVAVEPGVTPGDNVVPASL
jgi:hypothetical protein